MNSKVLIGICIVVSFIAFGRMLQLYVWPRLRGMSREDALNALAVPHMFRFVGLSFLMPGVGSPMLSPEFAKPAATAILSRHSSPSSPPMRCPLEPLGPSP